MFYKYKEIPAEFSDIAPFNDKMFKEKMKEPWIGEVFKEIFLR